MSITQKIKTRLNDPLATFKWFERVISAVCILIPLGLRLTDKDSQGVMPCCFRESVSDYAYMYHSYVFGTLFAIAAMLFIFNGAVYFKNENKLPLRLNKNGKWYNVVLGLSLLFLAILPWKEFFWPHTIFAGIFFVGNALVIGIFHKPKYRVASILLAILTIVFFVLFLVFYLLKIFPREFAFRILS